MFDRTTMSIQMHKFIRDTFLFGSSETQFSSADSFLERGIIDSTGILELVGFIQKTCNIQIEDHEMLPENLDSIDNVLRFIEEKLSR